MSGSLTCVLGLVVVVGWSSLCSVPVAPLEPIPEPVANGPELSGAWFVGVLVCGVG